jgi:gliding motility-associated protein GldM
MSGGNCPETPRQKMIGMMYLFLTAMLALNVSGELLNAFQLVDRSILQAKESVEAKNKSIYAEFESAYAMNETKVGDNYQRSMQIRDVADSLVKHIQDLKELFVLKTDGPEFNLDNYPSKANQDVAAQVMITEKGGERSKELKRRINDYRELLKSFIDIKDTGIIRNLDKILNTDDGPMKDNVEMPWESVKFEHLPLAASMALLTQMQADVRNMESDVVRYLYTKIDEGSFKFNSVEAIVIPRSDYVIRGSEYYAEIMMAARDTTQPPIVTVGGNALTVEGGRGVLKIPASSVGRKTWSGEIAVMRPDGTYDRREVTGSYIVAQPNVVISPTKMNVFYEGVDNPVEISAPGIPSENLNITITNAKLVKSGADYIVRPNKSTAGKIAIVSVTAKEDGKTQNLGKKEFRIKRVPDPVAKINDQRDGKIAKALLLAQLGVMADMENFEFDLKFRIVGFNVSTIVNGYLNEFPSKNSFFTEDQKNLMKRTGRSQKIFVTDIQAEGPDGSVRALGSITLVVD